MFFLYLFSVTAWKIIPLSLFSLCLCMTSFEKMTGRMCGTLVFFFEEANLKSQAMNISFCPSV